MNPQRMIIPKIFTADQLNYEAATNKFETIIESTIPTPFNFMDDTFEQLDQQHFELVDKVIDEYQSGKTIGEEEFFLKLKQSATQQ